MVGRQLVGQLPVRGVLHDCACLPTEGRKRGLLDRFLSRTLSKKPLMFRMPTGTQTGAESSKGRVGRMHSWASHAAHACIRAAQQPQRTCQHLQAPHSPAQPAGPPGLTRLLVEAQLLPGGDLQRFVQSAITCSTGAMRPRHEGRRRPGRWAAAEVHPLWSNALACAIASGGSGSPAGSSCHPCQRPASTTAGSWAPPNRARPWQGAGKNSGTHPLGW